MCGIAGIIRHGEEGRGVQRRDLEAVCRAMTAALEHRGPDDEGYFRSDAVVLGHRQLRIVDLSPNGRQPLTNEDRTLWLTYNGELYDSRERRRELETRGHRFRSESDAEIVLHLFEEWGEDAFQRLDGMFAFALWSEPQQTLFLVRDRLGMKPLFYWRAGGLLRFASEIKALRAGSRAPLELDLQGVADTFDFFYTVAPRTCFRNVSAVRPGHYLEVTRASVREVEYWDAEFVASRGWRPWSRPRVEARRLTQLLLDAVERHLVGQFPVGVTLSGGLDSSVVTAAMVRLGHRPTAFSLGFDDPALDESSHAERFARGFGLELVRLRSHADLGFLLGQAVWAMEQPLALNIFVPLLTLARGIHEHGYRVVLSGEGADEIFAGYDVFKMNKIRPVFGMCPRIVRDGALKAILGWMHLPPDAVGMAERVLSSPTDRVVRDIGCYPAWYDLWSLMHDLRSRVLTPEALTALDRPTIPEALDGLKLDRVRHHDALTQSLYVELKTRLPFVLAIGDRLAMAYSVEQRMPFLDRELTEFAFRLPASMKLHGLTEKHILRRAARGLVPRAVTRRRKYPFHGPIREWFFEGRCGEHFRTLLEPRELSRTGLINVAFVGEMLHYLRVGPRRSFTAMQYEWALLWVLTLQILWQQFVDGRDRGGESGLLS